MKEKIAGIHGHLPSRNCKQGYIIIQRTERSVTKYKDTKEITTKIKRVEVKNLKK
jgi:folate-dependent phosphoribosylglycinamide formyltransferase PurN